MKSKDYFLVLHTLRTGSYYYKLEKRKVLGEIHPEKPHNQHILAMLDKCPIFFPLVFFLLLLSSCSLHLAINCLAESQLSILYI